ncbi:MAG: hypothetical protein ACOCQ7_01440 [Natronomonas sp.]
MNEPVVCRRCRGPVPAGVRTCSTCGLEVKSMTASRDYVVFGLLLSPVSAFSLYAAGIAFVSIASSGLQLDVLQLALVGGILGSLVILGLLSPVLILSGIGRRAIRSRIDRRISNVTR